MIARNYLWIALVSVIPTGQDGTSACILITAVGSGRFHTWSYCICCFQTQCTEPFFFPSKMLKNPFSSYLQQLLPAQLWLALSRVFLGRQAQCCKCPSANTRCVQVSDFSRLVFRVHFPCDNFTTAQLVTARNCHFAANTELFFVRKTTRCPEKVLSNLVLWLANVLWESEHDEFERKPGTLDQNLFVSNHIGAGCNLTGVDWPRTTPVRCRIGSGLKSHCSLPSPKA